MDKTQEEKCSRSWTMCERSIASADYKRAWSDCIEANVIGEEPRIPDGYFKIGEEVEAKIGGEYIKCLVVARDINSPRNNSDACHVRRIPAWAPKDGEEVLTRVKDRAEIGYVKGGFVLVRGITIPLVQSDVIPLDVDNLGRPWSEI